MHDPMVRFLGPFFFLLGLVVVAVLLIAYVASIFWAAQDAQSRGKSGCLVALLVALLHWPLGLIAWLVFRPDQQSPTRAGRAAHIPCQCGRRLLVEERQAGTKITCPSCGAEVMVPPLSQLQRILAEEGFKHNAADQ
jgi:DNA-directed RNA polymerase subunit RPC12/RpoP